MSDWSRLCRIALACTGCVALAATVPTATADSFPTTPYVLADESTYQEGCFDPCDCAIMQEQALVGTFDLVFYPYAGPLWTVAVENVQWSVPSMGKQITGQGIYRRAGDQQNLHLDLKIDGQAPHAFDSGWVPDGNDYPLIDVTLSMNGLYCYDIALHVRAKPAEKEPYLSMNRALLTWTEVPGSSGYDVVAGNLLELRSSGGDFGSAVDGCLGQTVPGTALGENVAVAPGQVVWFLVRSAGGSYDAGDPAQSGSCDAGIASSPLACE
jgi:hypothetical protein